MAKHFIPEIGERALIVGQTGSGKTAFATWILLRLTTAPVIIYDTKEETKFPKLPNSVVVETMERVAKEYDNPEWDYIILRPHVDMLAKPDMLDSLLYYHYQHFRHSVAYIDELYSFHNNGRAGPGIVALYTRGRSKGITTVASSQRPAMISRFCVTESQKVYAFRLGDKADRKRLSDVIPNFDKYDLPPKHGFYFYESGEDAPELMRPIKLDASLNTGYVDEVASDPDGVREPEANSGTKHVWI